MLVDLHYLLLFSIMRMAHTQRSPFHVRGNRNAMNPNIVTMECISSVENMENIGDPHFFLNGTDLEERGDIEVLWSGGSINFLLRQDLEGDYTCTRGIDSSYARSRPVQFVVRPSPDITPTSHTIFAEFGKMAVLSCSLSPGRLIQQYYATWRNGSSKEIYAKIPRPRFTTNQPTTTHSNSRYSVDPSTLALVISDVVLSDSDTRYRCEVGVEDPQDGNNAFLFRATVTTDITLVVYKHPRITEPPSPAVVSLAEKTPLARYHCMAVGDPAPQITWTHNGHATTSPTMYLTSTSVPEQSDDGCGFIVIGTLVIFSLTEESSGSVTCTAGITPRDITMIGKMVPKDIHKTSLSVLGGFKNIDVLITQEGDVIFKLILPALINMPVHLFLVYEDGTYEKDREQGRLPSIMNRTTTTSFNDTKMVTHIESKSRLPFEVFRVGVALFNRPILGPIEMSQKLHNVNIPTLVPISLMKLQLLTAAICPILFFLLLFVTITIITCVIFCIREKRAKLEFQEMVMREHKAVLQIFIEKLPKNPSETTYMKLLEFIERILTNSTQNYEIPSHSLDEEVDDVDGDGMHAQDESERVSVDMEKLELLSSKRRSSALLQTMRHVIETGMQNPRLRPHLRQMSALVGESAPHQKILKHALSEPEPLPVGHWTLQAQLIPYKHIQQSAAEVL